MAKLERDNYPLPEPNWGSGDWRNDPHQKQMDALLEASKKLPEGQIEGAVLRWQRGDGYAFYIVTKERPLTLQWIPYGDCWQIEAALIRGLNLADVRGMVAAERRLAALFGKK